MQKNNTDSSKGLVPMGAKIPAELKKTLKAEAKAKGFLFSSYIVNLLTHRPAVKL